MSDSSIVRFRAVIEAALVALEARREEVNALNVFPVADGDTGDNMVLTLRAVVQELDRLASASRNSAGAGVEREDLASAPRSNSAGAGVEREDLASAPRSSEDANREDLANASRGGAGTGVDREDLANASRSSEDANREDLANASRNSGAEAGVGRQDLASASRNSGAEAGVGRQDLATASRSSRAEAEVDREDLVASVARAALLGARGSSGVILSQLVRGAAEELASRPGELIDPVLICAAMARAADQAYGSVRTPTEGTMLTVVREMAARMASELAHMREGRLPSDATDLEQNAVIAALVERALEAGRESVQRGPELLPVLREAGVVDAGGYGLVVALSGIVGALRGTAPELLEHTVGARVTHPQHSSTTYRYCTNYVVTGSGLEARRYVPELEGLGDSVLVVGDAATLRVHLHTDSPKAATALFAGAGAVSHLDVADMRAPATVEERIERTPSQEVCGLVAVAGGPGIRSLFESFGACVLDGGPSGSDGAADGEAVASPSPYDLLAAIHATDAEEVVVLPNSAEVLEAARRAAALSDKTAYVVDCRSHQAGLAAAAALDPWLGARENAQRMSETVAHIRTGSVSPALADDMGGRFHAGDAVAFLGGELVAWGQPREALRAVLERLADGAELITCLRGVDAPLDDRTVETLAAGEVEFELSDGGQRWAWWLLSAE